MHMELKEFIKTAVSGIISAIDDASTESSREVTLVQGSEGQRSIEFDIAVGVSHEEGSRVGGGIKVFEMISGGGEKSDVAKNETVSRIRFGVYVKLLKKDDETSSAVVLG